MNQRPFSEEMLLLANSLVSGERQSAYGHPLDNFSLIGAFFDVFIIERLRQLGVDVNAVLNDNERGCCYPSIIRAEDVGALMILLKVAREMNVHKSDNQTDIAGYAKTVEMVHEERERRDDR